MAAFVDNNANLWESRLIDDVKCISPLDLKEIAFDFRSNIYGVKLWRNISFR